MRVALRVAAQRAQQPQPCAARAANARPPPRPGQPLTLPPPPPFLRTRQGLRSFAKKALPKDNKAWAKLLQTAPPNAPKPKAGTSAQYASYVLNAAYGLDCLSEVRNDMRWLQGAFKDERQVQAVKFGEGTTAEFVDDMNLLFQAQQATDEERSMFNDAKDEKDRKVALSNLTKYTPMEPLTQQLLGSFKDEGVLFDLPEIVDEFELMTKKVLKEINIDVVSPAELTDGQKLQILDVMKKYLDKDANIFMNEKIDKSLIAGFQLYIEDRFVDLSAKKSVDRILEKIPQ